MTSRSVGGVLLAVCLSVLCAARVDAATRWTPHMTLDDGGWNVDEYPRMLADVNGDGLDDIVGFGASKVYVSLSTGTSFRRPQVWLRDDFVRNATWDTSKHVRRMGDVDGDGRADIVGFGSSYIFVGRSTGTSFLPRAAWSATLGYNHGWRVEDHERVVGDVDGDGRDDIVGFGTSRTYVLLSRGDAFTHPIRWSDNFGSDRGYRNERHSRQLGDVDGDGRADAVAFANAGVYVMRSTGAGFEAAYKALSDMGYDQRGGSARYPRLVGDVNGDGRDDVVTIVDGGALVALSNGRTFGPVQYWVDTFGAQTGWATRNVRTLGDVDGSGSADLVGFADGEVRVATAVADRFESTFEPLSGGDFATRLVSWQRDRCLTTTGSRVEQHRCDHETPLGWTLTANDDGTHTVAQDGKCLSIWVGDGATRPVEASAGHCGAPSARWYVERDLTGEYRLRSAAMDRCLRVPGHETGDHVALVAGRCDASDELLWTALSMRPRTFQTVMRAAGTGRCVLEVSSYDYVTRTHRGLNVLDDCSDESGQRYAFIDDGHGSYQIRGGSFGRCVTASGALGGVACDGGAPDQGFALVAREDGTRQIVSQSTGRCVAWSAASRDLRTAPCADVGEQLWVMPEMAATGLVGYSLQDVGSPQGTALVAAHGSGAYVTRDPRAIVAFARRAGLVLSEADFDALLSVAQRGEFRARVGGWDAALGPVEARAELVTVVVDYDVGLDGAALGVEANGAEFGLELGGTMYPAADVKVLSAEARFTLDADGITLAPSVDLVAASAGWGNDARSHVGLSAGIGSRGFAAGARWGQAGQYGVTFPLGVTSVDIYVHQDDVLSAVAYADDAAVWAANSTVDAFSTGWSWTSDAFETAVDGFTGFFEDVGGAIGDVFEEAGDFFSDVGDTLGDVGKTIAGWFGF